MPRHVYWMWPNNEDFVSFFCLIPCKNFMTNIVLFQFTRQAGEKNSCFSLFPWCIGYCMSQLTPLLGLKWGVHRSVFMFLFNILSASCLVILLELFSLRAGFQQTKHSLYFRRFFTHRSILSLSLRTLLWTSCRLVLSMHWNLYKGSWN